MSPWFDRNGEDRWYDHPMAWRVVTTLAFLLAAISLALNGWVFYTIQTDRSNTREGIRTAIVTSCADLNHKIQQTRDPRLDAYNAFLIGQIAENFNRAEAKRAKKLADAAADAQLKPVQCKRVVRRALP